ncbi:MAG: hypothetical protein COV47_03045 [Candidatus Diapherotrites archaeon CG11_big_fil_rev_8_21_14_0_20_37_9]|nr:MAG: hypothetical protein COV47_03045 [Candidatus Diapherotrites archaeon CG11_big_fil_rev_8_21_14_0_20_37_9]
MQKRSKIIRSGKIEIYLASLEDIFLLKSVSSRESDVVDCENILSKTTLNWKTIYSEIKSQENNLFGVRENVILDHLEALEKRLETKIPIVKKLLNVVLEKSIVHAAKNPVTIKQIMEKIDFPETTIRNKIHKLLKNKKLIKTNKNPLEVTADKDGKIKKLETTY